MVATKESLTVGDTVMWAGTWGKDKPKDIKVAKIIIGSGKHFVNSIKWKTIYKKRVTIIFDNGDKTFGSRLSN